MEQGELKLHNVRSRPHPEPPPTHRSRSDGLPQRRLCPPPGRLPCGHGSELGAPLPLLSRERAADRAVALAVPLRTVGSTYERPGALALISQSGEYGRLLASGCLEGELRRACPRRGSTPDRRGRALYDMRDLSDLVWCLWAGCEMHCRLTGDGMNDRRARAKKGTASPRDRYRPAHARARLSEN